MISQSGARPPHEVTKGGPPACPNIEGRSRTGPTDMARGNGPTLAQRLPLLMLNLLLFLTNTSRAKSFWVGDAAPRCAGGVGCCGVVWWRLWCDVVEAVVWGLWGSVALARELLASQPALGVLQGMRKKAKRSRRRAKGQTEKPSAEQSRPRAPCKRLTPHGSPELTPSTSWAASPPTERGMKEPAPTLETW